MDLARSSRWEGLDTEIVERQIHGGNIGYPQLRANKLMHQFKWECARLGHLNDGNGDFIRDFIWSTDHLCLWNTISSVDYSRIYAVSRENHHDARFIQACLYQCWRQVLATTDSNVLVSAENVYHSLAVNLGLVAGRKPVTLRVIVESITVTKQVPVNPQVSTQVKFSNLPSPEGLSASGGAYLDFSPRCYLVRAKTAAFRFEIVVPRVGRPSLIPNPATALSAPIGVSSVGEITVPPKRTKRSDLVR